MEDTVQNEVVPCASATLKYARISSRKVKIVADLIRGKDAMEAFTAISCSCTFFTSLTHVYVI